MTVPVRSLEPARSRLITLLAFFLDFLKAMKTTMEDDEAAEEWRVRDTTPANPDSALAGETRHDTG